MVVIQRPVKGSRISSFYPVHELPQLSSLDSAFQLQEYISLLIRLNVHDVDTIVSIPGKGGSHEREGSDGGSEKEGADKEGKNEVTVDESCWVYEQLRRLAQDLSHPLITTLQQECTRQTCPEMKAGEWLYLCVAHGNEGAMEQCCAIDYILHTLDSATALLNSPRAFPSRLSIPPSSTRHFSSLARRLGRIFAHAYYHHREAFEQAEAESSLYARFLALTSKFALVPSEFLVIPPRMNVQLHARDEDEHEDAPHGTNEPALDFDAGEYAARRAPGQDRLWLPHDPRTGSPPGPAGDARNPSPRKGRSRTDTMVHSEAVSVAEELARGAGLHEAAALEREVAQERRNVYEPPEYASSQPASAQRIEFEDLSEPAPAPEASETVVVEQAAEQSPPSEAPSETTSAVEPKHEEETAPREGAPAEKAEEAVETAEPAETIDTADLTEEETEAAPTEAQPEPEEVEEVDVTESTEHPEPAEGPPSAADHTSTEVKAEDVDESKEHDSLGITEGGTEEVEELEELEELEEGLSAGKNEEPAEKDASEEAHTPAHEDTIAAPESEDAPVTDVSEADSEPK